MKIKNVEDFTDFIESLEEEENEIGLTKENIEESKVLFEVKLVDTDSHMGLIFAVASETSDLPMSLKLAFVGGLNELLKIILSDKEETRQ